MCLLEQIRQAIRRRDLFVQPSIKWTDPRKELLQGEEWTKIKPAICKGLDRSENADVQLALLQKQLDECYHRTARNLDTNSYLKIEQNEKGKDYFVLSPLEALDEPAGMSELREQIKKMMPQLDLPSLIMEVNRWTNFDKQFLHLTEQKNKVSNFATSLGAVLLSEACNVGIEPIQRPNNPALSKGRLDWVKQTQENLVAWCIVPYDNQNRNAEERAQMLQELNFSKYVWDWRAKHIPLLEEEIVTMKKYAIDLMGVWFWIDGGSGKIIDDANETILQALAATKTTTTIWISFPARYFENLSDAEKVEKGAKTIGYVYKRAKQLGCKIALYNHGDWFGEPINMVKIIKALKHKDIGLVYNFHHAHYMLENYEKDLALMMPYLWTVNLNGMKKNSSKILPIGQGDLEAEMIRTLIKSGFKGTIGILGHLENADVKETLATNLNGLEQLLK